MDPIVEALVSGPPSASAIRDSKRLWTRGELVDAVGRVSAGLRRAGVGPSCRVEVVAHSSVPIVAALLGARSLGAIVCPIDPRVATTEKAFAGVTATVADRAIPNRETIDVRAMLAEEGRLEPESSGFVAWGVRTSGTSGKVKTVLLTEAGVAHVSDAIQQVVPYRPEDRVLCCLPMHHTYGLSQLWLALRAGSTLFMPTTGPLLPADVAVWAKEASILPTIAPTLRSILRLGESPRVRLVTLAGQATLPDDRRSFVCAMPDTEFVNFYGLTEATTRVLWLPHDDFLAYPDATGRPIPGVRGTLDEDGELWVDGPNVAAGYLDDAEATAVRFPGGRLRTGDLFAESQGLFSYIGRRDGVFKSFGEKVVPELVERAIQDHPNVVSCLVTPDVGEDGETRPIAFVVVRENVSSAELLRFVRSKLSSVALPARVVFTDALPATASGKVLRRPPPGA
jgi:acyl-CoA synthetase (AMP-forming)/AMP-acid ligase II